MYPSWSQKWNKRFLTWSLANGLNSSKFVSKANELVKLNLLENFLSLDTWSLSWKLPPLSNQPINRVYNRKIYLISGKHKNLFSWFVVEGEWNNFVVWGVRRQTRWNQGFPAGREIPRWQVGYEIRSCC